MESVLSLVRQCQEVSRKCESLLPSDPTPSLLLLYQLEAQLYLGVLNSVADIMSIISTLPQIEPKLYETVAGEIQVNMYMYNTCTYYYHTFAIHVYLPHYQQCTCMFHYFSSGIAEPTEGRRDSFSSECTESCHQPL